MDRKAIIGVSVIAAIAIVPFIDGLIAKRVITHQIELLSKQAEAQDGKSLYIADYKVGWLSSTIVLGVQENMGSVTSPPIKIHHGPIVFFYGKPKLALANIFIDYKMPAELQSFLNSSSTSLIQYDALFSLNMKSVYHYFKIADFSVQSSAVNFGGMIGTMDMTFHNDEMTSYKSTVSLGETSMLPLTDLVDLPNLKTGIINSEVDASYGAHNLILGTFNTNVASFDWTAETGANIIAHNLKFGTNTEIIKDKFNASFTLSVDSLETNKPEFPFSKIDNFSAVFALKDLNPAGVASLSDDENDDYTSTQQLLMLVHALTPSSSISFKTSAVTNAGAFEFDMNLSAQGTISKDSSFSKNMNAELHGRVGMGLVEMYLQHYVADLQARYRMEALAKQQPAPVQTDPRVIAKAIIQQAITNGYLIQDKTDYVVKFSKTGDKSQLNGKDVSELANNPEAASDAAFANIINQVAPAPAPPPAPVAAEPVAPAPAATPEPAATPTLPTMQTN